MAEPIWVIDLFGVKFVVDTSNFLIINFDTFDVDMASNAETSLEILGVDYQVPAGKTLRLLGVLLCGSENTGDTVLTQTDTADSQVGSINKWIPPIDIGGIGVGAGPVTIFDPTFAASKFLTVHNTVAATRAFTVVGLVGLEFTA